MSVADNTIQHPNENCSKDHTCSSMNVVEGRLGNYYQKAVERTLQKFLSHIKFSVFKTKFPEIYKENHNHLRGIHQQLLSQLKDNITKDVDLLCNETKLYPSLKLLDDIIKKHSNRSGEDSWRPSGNPEDDTRDHIYHLKQKQKKCLEFVLETILAENALLEKTVNQNHANILTLKKEVDILNEEIINEIEILNNDSIVTLNKDIHALAKMQ
ncbi:uncharacterized protein NPIL_76491 [Nephila pilipes]|uniref:Uncharacterized protein n=1 Tax=Nephila pilipes TaxID=299642 RepID=A0A8X6NQF5_NEPPI|nr:uncharacterized protein NPIL_76491 [Nephila pilipes]